MNSPKISVIMPAYNEEIYISIAIKSILNQSYSNFEFIIINDSSTDDTENIIKNFKDKRIIYIKNKQNIGITKSLNIGIKQSSGVYIARMDANDISVKHRFQTQIDFLQNNSNIGACGSWIKIINNGKIWKYATNHDQIITNLFFNNMMAHPTIMIRKQLLLKYNLFYNENYKKIQDYDMWVRCSRYFKLANIPKVLLHYRLEQNDIKNKYWDNKTQLIINSVRENQLKEININYNKQELKLHHSISNKQYARNQKYLKQVHNWFNKLKKANLKNKLLPEPTFSNLLDTKYQEIDKWINTSFLTRGIKFIQYYANKYIQ